MSDFDDLLDAASPLTKDVPLYLDGALVAERDRILREYDELRAQKKNDGRAGQQSPVVQKAEELQAVMEKMQSRVLTIRMTQMPGTAWVALKNKYPLRPKKPGRPEPGEFTHQDMQLGFKVEAAVRQYLLKFAGRVLDDDTVEELTTSQWTKLFDKVSGGDLERLMMEAVDLNQLEGQAHAEELLKASRRTEGSEKK